MDRIQKTGAAAVVSIVCAIGGYVTTCAGHPFQAIFLQIVALISGGIGLIMAASPRVRGGMLSIGAMALAVVGLVFAILGVVGVVLT